MQKTILVVDDEKDIRDFIAKLLQARGYEPILAADGVEAVAKACDLRPDVILLDLLMPRMDGREALRRLRRANVWTPTILLTQVGEASERALALEEGADDYINKPFDPHELLARVSCWIGSPL